MIIAGTGHRPDKLGGYTAALDMRLQVLAMRALREHAPALVVSGMALGWDVALASAAVRLDIPFIAAIPFEGQESRWPESSQYRYRQLLKQAAGVEIVCTGGYAGWKMQRRNEWMVGLVDADGVMLALWNGSDGGTANCVRYAERVGKPVVNLWHEFEVVA